MEVRSSADQMSTDDRSNVRTLCNVQYTVREVKGRDAKRERLRRILRPLTETSNQRDGLEMVGNQIRV